MDCWGVGRERAEGLILLWMEEVNLKVLSYSSNHIGGIMEDNEENQEWVFNGIYGYLEEHNKRHTWRLLEELVGRGGERVLCFGDLNDTIFEHEKMGGNIPSNNQFNRERQSLDLCGLRIWVSVVINSHGRMGGVAVKTSRLDWTGCLLRAILLAYS